MIKDIIEISPSTRNAAIDGMQVMFRAYIASDNTERLVWKIDDKTGNGAMLDKLEGLVILPQGREIKLDGQTSHYIDIPRWLTDALINDFSEFEADAINPLDDSTDDHLTTEKTNTNINTDDDDDDITPIFDDIEVDEGGS